MEQTRKQSNEEFARELERRTRRFAVEIIRLSSSLPHNPEGKVLRNQLTKSGTSVGANYREVNRARSLAEFNSRIKICESEASETQYWLEVIKEAALLPKQDIVPHHRECTELLAIFTAIANQKQ